jgi:hypothetical protein
VDRFTVIAVPEGSPGGQDVSIHYSKVTFLLGFVFGS